MAKPRIFISSTYYDLRLVRGDLERYIKELGYEAILFERGHIAYGKEDALEEYCYREIATCDIVVTIIGGKRGTQSRDEKHSITQRELKAAIDAGKPIYTFVEKPVLNEYRTYQANKDVSGFRPAAVNDVRIYSFIEEIYGLPSGNPVEGFETSGDIAHYLRDQWAGLFQRLLQESSRKRETSILEGLMSTADTLKSLVTFLTEQQSKGDEAIKDILLSNHPAFAEVKRAAKIPYRIIFYTLGELDKLLSARNFTKDEFSQDHDWDNVKQGFGVRVSNEIFDENDNLRIVTPEQWNSDWVSTYRLSKSDGDDDIPF